ncbi:MAG: hypothetical protein D6689_21620 [Deltaproteobacteria bacterium]|nr:MAG: hypothetical protein D6689_21620 [Deltaproteobacteria bacterium]
MVPGGFVFARGRRPAARPRPDSRYNSGTVRRPTLAAALLAATVQWACGGAAPSEPRAADGVRAYLAAARTGDAAAAWALLADDVRRALRHDQFVAAWRAFARERRRQVRDLAGAVADGRDVDERATVVYADGTRVGLRYERGRWHIDTPLVAGAAAPTAADAIARFAAALDDRDYAGAIALLSERRRAALNRFVDEFAGSLRDQSARDAIQFTGDDRAVFEWDADGTRYRIFVVREGDQWRIDDFDVQPAPQPSP